jgi:hypothetical protein
VHDSDHNDVLSIIATIGDEGWHFPDYSVMYIGNGTILVVLDVCNRLDMNQQYNQQQ